jgi:hypothetical protein
MPEQRLLIQGSTPAEVQALLARLLQPAGSYLLSAIPEDGRPAPESTRLGITYVRLEPGEPAPAPPAWTEQALLRLAEAEPEPPETAALRPALDARLGALLEQAHARLTADFGDTEAGEELNRYQQQAADEHLRRGLALGARLYRAALALNGGRIATRYSPEEVAGRVDCLLRAGAESPLGQALLSRYPAAAFFERAEHRLRSQVSRADPSMAWFFYTSVEAGLRRALRLSVQMGYLSSLIACEAV